MKIIDLHCDTLLWSLFNEGNPFENSERQISRDKLIQGESMAQCFAVFAPGDGKSPVMEQSDKCYEMFTKLVENYKKAISISKGWLAPAKNAADISANQAAGKISSILTIEDGAFIGEDMGRIDQAYKSGAVMLALTWNYENSIGYPNSDDSARHLLKLKPFGRELVEHMNDLNMLVDVSHLNEGGFWDVADISKHPFVATHSCAAAVVPHRRNLTDRQLKAIADSGGVIGICFYPDFASSSGAGTTVEDVVQQVKYVINAAGENAVAFGSDFDGMDGANLEFKDYGGYQMIVQALSGELPQKTMEKICYLNAMRVLDF